MKDYLYTLLQNSNVLTAEQVLTQTVAAIGIGLVIYLSYWLSHAGTIYSKKFNVSLVMLTVLTATVMAVIGSNVALSLGMVGALSIVRYRTAIKDSRDTAYIFWAIIAGICCGSGNYLIVCTGSSAIFVLLLFLGRVRSDNRLLLIIRGPREKERQVESFVYQRLGKRTNLRVKNSTEDSIELIYEISKQVLEKANKDQSILEQIYTIGNIEYVNIVAQSDEIV